MKGFATSLSIVLSFGAGIILFNFQVTHSFLVGTCIVVGATYLYNQPDGADRRARSSVTGSPRPFDSIGSRLYPNSSQFPSQSGVAPHSTLHNQSFSSSPPAKWSSGAPSDLASSPNSDHVGFPQGPGILDGATWNSRATTLHDTVIEGVAERGIAIDMLNEKLAAQQGAGVSTGPEGALQAETSPWVLYGPGAPSLAQRRGLNDVNYESPLTP